MFNLKFSGAKNCYSIKFRDKELNQVIYIYTARTRQFVNSVPSGYIIWALKESKDPGANLTK